MNSPLAIDDARQAGFDGAIFLNKSGHVAEGATSNCFMVRDGQLITPGVAENALEGIPRDGIISHSASSDRASSKDPSTSYVTNSSSPVPLLVFDPSSASTSARSKTNLSVRSPAPSRSSIFGATCGHREAQWNWLTPVYQARMKHEQERVSMAETIWMERALLPQPSR